MNRRIANNTNHILKSVLLITDCQHRQKIQLRAMDVVLFGPPTASKHHMASLCALHHHYIISVGYSYWKDAIVVLSTSVCLFGILYALRQRRSAQSHVDTFLESIRVYEKELQELKEK